MVSRRNYLAITMLMAIIFFLFQFLNVAREYMGDYDTNSYAVEVDELSGEDSVFRADEHKDDEDSGLSERGSVVCIGESKGSFAKLLKSWAFYMKCKEYSYESLSEYETSKDKPENVRFMLVDPDCISLRSSRDIRSLKRLTNNGVSIIFARLPESSVIDENKGLRDFLGISSVRKKSVLTEGIHLYSGLLIGGETIYKVENEDDETEAKRQDLELTMPWYELTSGTKVYMKGILEKAGYEAQEYPPIIWRFSTGSAYVFAINGDYMRGATGLGLLTGMLSQMQEYTVYPVVNAQNFVVTDYPSFADENTDELMEIYSQSLAGVYRDVVWPALSSLNERISLGITSMLTVQMDYDDENEPDASNLSYYLEVLNEQKAEAGYSLYSYSNTDVEAKLEADYGFWKEGMPSYSFSSLYRAGLSDKTLKSALGNVFLENVRTVFEDVSDEAEVIGYFNDYVTYQRALIDGYEHTYSQDIKIRSIETALGYTSIIADMSRIAYPQSEADRWEKLSKELMANTLTYWKPYSKFDGTTLSQSDERIRSYLALDYSESMGENELKLTVSENVTKSWFILRFDDKRVTSVEGGSAKKLEDSVWLVEVDGGEAIISLDNSKNLYYHE